MNKEELVRILEELGKACINDNIDCNVFVKVVEGLIRTNQNMVQELEEFADFLAQVHEPKDADELYDGEDLKVEIKKVFKF